MILSIRPVIISFPASQKRAQQLAVQGDFDYKTVAIHHFPDGESKVTLPSGLPEKVIIYQSLDRPNQKLIDLILLAGGLKKQGVAELILVAPYLCYMRQDKAFHPGEVVSQQVIGKLLADYFDGLLTVDAHLHRVHNLSQVLPCKRAVNISATRPMSEFLHSHVKNPFLIGPDNESEQWVADIAKQDQLDYQIASKIRLGDQYVQINLPRVDYQNRNIVLVDDVASTGKTLLETAKQLWIYSPASISVLVSHALFVDNAVEQLQAVGIKNIWSCDSVMHPTNQISLAKILAEQLSHF